MLLLAFENKALENKLLPMLVVACHFMMNVFHFEKKVEVFADKQKSFFYKGKALNPNN